MRFLLIAAFIGMFSFTQILFANEGAAGHGAGKGHVSESGANLDLFPAPVANPAKATRPGALKTEAPAALSKVTGGAVALKWTAADGADSYHLQVATDANFKWLIVNENWIRGNSYELKGLQAGKQYFWRVAGLNPNNDPESLKGPYAKSMFEAR